MWAALLISAGITVLLFRNLLPDVATHLYSDLGDPLLNTPSSRGMRGSGR
jgi:hypothetical protein